MNCLECTKDTYCCDMGVTLTRKEIKKYKKKKLVPLSENGLILGYVFVLNKKGDGSCVYQDNNTGLCCIYEDRPEACKKFRCI